VALLAQGLSLRAVARQVQASVSSVSHWREAWRQGGEAALAPKPVPGRPRRLTDQQREPLRHLLLKGASAYGFPNEWWTLRRIAAVIQVEFGVRYHPAHVWKILRRLGWSCQVSEPRPIQRDAHAIAHGQRDQWPAIKKVRRLGAHLALLEESGVLLIPTRRRMWSPVGQTPLVPSNDKHDRLSALAARTVSPKRQPLGLSLRFQPHNCQAVQVADFLRALLRHLRGHVVLLWDRGSTHKGPAIDAVCQAYPRLHLEAFPAYAPELNPAEQVWNDCKGHTANSLLRDMRDLRWRLHAKTRRVRRSQAKLRSFILTSKLPSPP
jgi:transposase